MPNIDDVLRDTARAIKPDKYVTGEQSNVANWIKKTLEAKSKYSISMTKLAGSYGKRTTIIGSDVDIVVFIKGVQPPFDNVIDEFYTILRDSTVANIRTTKYSLQFTVASFEFDLLLATDFVNENIGAHERISLQQQRTLNVILRKGRRHHYRYSPSLTFSAIEFMKKQTSFAHDVARLAKFWYKSVCITTYVSGAKYAMELIAIDAAIRVKDGNYYDALVYFLKTIQNFDKMDIIFDCMYDEISKKHWPSTNSNKARLIDPANPYNNLANSFYRRKRVIKRLQDDAAFTLSNLQGYRWSWLKDGMNSMCIIKIFYAEVFDIIQSRRIFITVTDEYPSDENRDVIINFGPVDSFTRRQVEFIYIYLTGLCKNLNTSDYQDEAEHFNELLRILEEVDIDECDDEVYEKYNFRDFEVSFSLPSPFGYFLLSFDLETDSTDSEPESEDDETKYSSEDDYY